MKKYSALLFLIFLFACSKEETKFELYSPETFAFDLDNNWEVNSSIRVKGFVQQRKEGFSIITLQYKVNLKDSSGKLLKNIIEDTFSESNQENVGDTSIEFQFNLDSTFIPGKYQLEYYCKDIISGKETNFKSYFQLED